MSLENCWGVLCFVPIDALAYKKIFGFAEFLAALALLAVLYTITDVRYKFRVAVTPGLLFPATYALIAFIGVATLATELWVAQQWFVPKVSGLNSSIWQAGLGLLFLGTFLTWTYYAYISPPVFGYRNGHRYLTELVRHALRGNEAELQVVVNEVTRSSEQLVKHCKTRTDKDYSRWNPALHNASFAKEVLLTLSDRRLCKIIVKSSPVTALALFEDMGKAPSKKFPMSTFSRNITMEAVAQKDSFLYSEVEGFQSGLFGYVKPVSQAVYGNFELLEGIQREGGLGTFDVEYGESINWDGEQWSAYFRAVLIAMKSYLKSGNTNDQSPVFISSLNHIETAYMDLKKISGMDDPYQAKAFQVFKAVCHFASEAVQLVEKSKEKPYVHRVRDDNGHKNIYDQLAEIMCQGLIDSAHVKGPYYTAHHVQHNTAWEALHGFKNGFAWRVVRLKTRRLMYEQFKRLVATPNYVSIRAAAFCLNVFGLTPLHRNVKHSRDAYVLSCIAQDWAKKHYMTIARDYPQMAEVMLTGAISFDEENSRLVQTNNYGMSKKTTTKFLDLLPAKPKEESAPTKS